MQIFDMVFRVLNDFFFLPDIVSNVCIVHVEHPVLLSLCTYHKPGIKVSISSGYTKKNSKTYGKDLETHRIAGISLKMLLNIFDYTV